MEENTKVPAEGAGGEPVSNRAEGEPLKLEEEEAGLEAEEGETGQETEEGEPPESEEGEGLFDGMSPEKLHESYKSLQTELGKRTEKLNKFEDALGKYGGLETVTNWVEYLSNNPDFSKWVQSQQEKQALGGGEADPGDPETKAAMETVRRITQQEIARAMQERVEPLADSYKQRILQDNMGKMDEEFPGWRDLQSEMAGLAETLPSAVQDNPSLNDLKSLYIRAVVETGKIADFGKSFYEKELKAVKKKSTVRPGKAPAGLPKKASTIQEAFALAKSQLK